MHRLRLLAASLTIGCAGLSARGDALAEVDPFIGVDGGGNVFPGACLPFSAVSVSPDIAPPQLTSGYRSNKPVIGLSLTHTSGTGGEGRGGNCLVTPQVGPLELVDLASPVADEIASPGYYAGTLSRSGVRCEGTLAERCGVQRYTFPATQPTGRLLVDVASSRDTNAADKRPSSWITAADVKLVGERGFEGSATMQGGWGNNAVATIYLAGEFDRPFAKADVWRDKPLRKPEITVACGVAAEFDTSTNRAVGLRVGISYASVENARKNLSSTAGKSFDDVRTSAEATWRAYLDKIKVEGGTPDERKLFYTSLYRSVVMPTDMTGDNPRWQSDEPHFWNFYCIWDTFHTTNSLFNLILRDRSSQIVRCLLDIYQHDGWLPDAWVSGDYASVQGGTNADILIADAVVKGVSGFDLNVAYEATKKDATTPGPEANRGRHAEYFKRGYLPAQGATDANVPPCPTSRTIEYALDDACCAAVARAAGHEEDALKFDRQSLGLWQLFNDDTKFFWAKDADGKWLDGFKPTLNNAPWRGPFYEGTPWQYGAYVPHDVKGLIDRHGGGSGFVAFLDQMFDGNFYSAANEPDLLTPWLYTYAGRPDRIVDRVRDILAKKYRPTRNGWPGNDDSGAMSAWYVFGALGFFPNAGSDVYLLGSPLFSKSTLDLGDGHALTIVADGLTPENRYVQSATLNSQPWTRGWFRHGDIANGGELRLTMGPKPSPTWGTGDPPPSVSERVK